MLFQDSVFRKNFLMGYHRLARYFVVRESTEGGIIQSQGLADYWLQEGCQASAGKGLDFPGGGGAGGN